VIGQGTRVDQHSTAAPLARVTSTDLFVSLSIPLSFPATPFHPPFHPPFAKKKTMSTSTSTPTSPTTPPTRKLRTKTSDLSDFLRGSRYTTTHDEQQQLPVPTPHRAASVHSSKSKRSRIPFLGRSRKKSSSSPERLSEEQLLPQPPLPGLTKKNFDDGSVRRSAFFFLALTTTEKNVFSLCV
jgi:hypothetical protein